MALGARSAIRVPVRPTADPRVVGRGMGVGVGPGGMPPNGPAVPSRSPLADMSVPVAQAPQVPSMGAISAAMANYRKTSDPWASAAQGFVDARAYGEEQAKEQAMLESVSESLSGHPDLAKFVTQGVMTPDRALSIAEERSKGTRDKDAADAAKARRIQYLIESGDDDLAAQYEAGVIGDDELADAITKRETPPDGLTADAAARAEIAPRYGLVEGTPAYTQFVLTGNLPTKFGDQENEETSEQTELARQNSLQNITNTEAALKEAFGQTNFYTTGMIGKAVRDMGLGGTPQYDLDATVNTVKANLGFEALAAMRAASPTGGALGNITERELAMLQSTVASLDPNQGEQQLAVNLMKVRNHLANLKRLANGEMPFDENGNPIPLPDDAAASSAPDVGTVEDGYRFKGGDPADPANWEKVD